MLTFLRIGAVFMFLGRAYEHIRWIGPFRDIFYHPQGVGGWYASLINRPLDEIYKDHFYESAISYFSDAVGVVYVLAALVILMYERLQRFVVVVYVAVGFLCLTYFGYLYGKNLDQYGMFFEHASQGMIPLLFVWCFKGYEKRTVLWGVLSISVTFFSHGLYAAGYYPQPGKFVDMMIIGFRMTEDIARKSLYWLGYADFVFAGVVLFVPYWVTFIRGNKVLHILTLTWLWYGVLWGFLTAFARIYTSFQPEMLLHWLDQYLFEFFVRFPHFLIPLVILYFYKEKR